MMMISSVHRSSRYCKINTSFATTRFIVVILGTIAYSSNGFSILPPISHSSSTIQKSTTGTTRSRHNRVCSLLSLNNESEGSPEQKKSSNYKNDGDSSGIIKSYDNNNKKEKNSVILRSRRRTFLSKTIFSGLVLLGSSSNSNSIVVNAAPPISIIAEELGYYPVTNRDGQTIYIPKRISRTSSQQAIELTSYLTTKYDVSMYGAYWCPHCSRQKELFGKEAFNMINYVECSTKGYGYKPLTKDIQNIVEGFPTWILLPKNGKNNKKDRIVFSGELPLSIIAQKANYPYTFNEELEENIPPTLGSSSCGGGK